MKPAQSLATRHTLEVRIPDVPRNVHPRRPGPVGRRGVVLLNHVCPNTRSWVGPWTSMAANGRPSVSIENPNVSGPHCLFNSPL